MEALRSAWEGLHHLSFSKKRREREVKESTTIIPETIRPSDVSSQTSTTTSQPLIERLISIRQGETAGIKYESNNAYLLTSFRNLKSSLEKEDCELLRNQEKINQSDINEGNIEEVFLLAMQYLKIATLLAWKEKDYVNIARDISIKIKEFNYFSPESHLLDTEISLLEGIRCTDLDGVRRLLLSARRVYELFPSLNNQNYIIEIYQDYQSVLNRMSADSKIDEISRRKCLSQIDRFTLEEPFLVDFVANPKLRKEFYEKAPEEFQETHFYLGDNFKLNFNSENAFLFTDIRDIINANSLKNALDMAIAQGRYNIVISHQDPILTPQAAEIIKDKMKVSSQLRVFFSNDEDRRTLAGALIEDEATKRRIIASKTTSKDDKIFYACFLRSINLDLPLLSSSITTNSTSILSNGETILYIDPQKIAQISSKRGQPKEAYILREAIISIPDLKTIIEEGSLVVCETQSGSINSISFHPSLIFKRNINKFLLINMSGKTFILEDNVQIQRYSEKDYASIQLQIKDE